jgi:hypothetical protein
VQKPTPRKNILVTAIIQLLRARDKNAAKRVDMEKYSGNTEIYFIKDSEVGVLFYKSRSKKQRRLFAKVQGSMNLC